jgi:hypothetical protein
LQSKDECGYNRGKFANVKKLVTNQLPLVGGVQINGSKFFEHHRHPWAEQLQKLFPRLENLFRVR